MPERKIMLLTFLLAMGLAGISHNHFATAAMIELTVKDLAVQSTDILRAQVVTTASEWNESRDFIFTRVTLRVTEKLKGPLAVGSTISVLVPGGEVDGVGLGVEHAARFKSGEGVIVFLKPIDNSLYGVTGWEQGKYTVENGQIKEKGISESQFLDEISAALK